MKTLHRSLWLVPLLAAAVAPAHATLLAQHFGVNPQVALGPNWEYRPGQTYQAYQFVASSLNPTLHTDTVDYAVNDWYGYWNQSTLEDYVTYSGDYPSGDEPYDIEAMYFDDDARSLYFAMIVGFPSPESGIWTESRYDNIAVVQGDFALDLPGTVGGSDSWGFDYDYGVDLTDEIRPSSGNVTALNSNTLGNNLYQTTAGSWYLGTPEGAVNPITGDESNSYTNFDPSASGLTAIGGVSVSWYNLDLYDGAVNVNENNWETYVIEVQISRSLLPQLNYGDAVGFQWLMGCRNDGSNETGYLSLDGDIDTPEPGSLALVLAGMGPLGLWWRRRKSTTAAA